MTRKIKDLTERELLDLLQQIKVNSIEVGGVVVESNFEDLSVVEETINRLLEKHKDFMLLRKELKIKTGIDK